MKIPVYILPTSNASTSDSLISFFNSNKLFILTSAPGLQRVLGVDNPTIEANQIITALDDARKKYPNAYPLLIKDSSLTSSNADILAALIIDAINLNKDLEKVKCSIKKSESCINSDTYDTSKSSFAKSSESDVSSSLDSDSSSKTPSKAPSCESDECSCETSCESSEYFWKLQFKKYNKKNKYKKNKRSWEIFYLANWLDRCDLYRSFSNADDLIKIAKTFSPNGLQAMLFSPRGRDMLLGRIPMRNHEFFTPIRFPLSQQLNENIQCGNISSITTTPNFFNYNVTLAKTKPDLLKLCECREPEEKFVANAIPLFWFLILGTFVVILAWFFYVTVGKKY